MSKMAVDKIKKINLKVKTKTRKISQKKEEAALQVVDLTQKNRELKRKIFDLYTIIEISRNFNAVLDYETLLDTFILTSMAQVGASKAALFLESDEKLDSFVLVKSKGDFQKSVAKKTFKSNSKMIKYITGINRPIATQELLQFYCNKRESELISQFDPGLLIPLVYQAKLRGLFIISEKMSNKSFSDDDIEFLSILASQISVAIENARLYNAEKNSTNQLRSAQQKLILSERLAALGEMSASVAHEINNPLGIIKNYILLTKAAIEGNDEATSNINIVTEEIDRIAEIVKELLDFHHNKEEKLEELSVIDVLEDVLKLMSRQLDRQSIKLKKNYMENCPIVAASRDNLKQVFLNIIINALDAMSVQGELLITVCEIGDQLKIRFCDDGPGIPPELISRVFEPFFTTKEPGKGTGLGLSVCYGIIKRHKGSISFSNYDGGGCIEISLPIVFKSTESKK